MRCDRGDWSSSTDAAAAYFACVNANGGINGRPIEYHVEDDQWNPEAAAAAAAKLVNDQTAVAMVGIVEADPAAAVAPQAGIGLLAQLFVAGIELLHLCGRAVGTQYP